MIVNFHNMRCFLIKWYIKGIKNQYQSIKNGKNNRTKNENLNKS